MMTAQDYRDQNAAADTFTTPAPGRDMHFRGATVVTAEQLAEVGLTPEDVPNLTTVDTKEATDD